MADATPAVVDPNESLRKLSESIGKYQAPSNWAYDPHYEAATNAIHNNIARLTSNNQLASQRVGEDYTKNVEQAGRINEQNQKSLQNKLANQGIAFSGVNVQEQGRLSEDYGRALNELNTGKTRSLENLAFDSANQAAQWQNALGAAQADRASRQTAREQEQAAAEAQAQAANDMANNQRIWMEQITTRLTSLAQPQPQPTGQFKPPPPPQQIVQQALAQVPPPAAKTPQQQAADTGVDVKYMQKILAELGFDPGPLDGIMGKKTQLALARWKQSQGMPATGDINGDIWNRLQGLTPRGDIRGMGGTNRA
jgi:hypothetical protein